MEGEYKSAYYPQQCHRFRKEISNSREFHFEFSNLTSKCYTNYYDFKKVNYQSYVPSYYYKTSTVLQEYRKVVTCRNSIKNKYNRCQTRKRPNFSIFTSSVL